MLVLQVHIRRDRKEGTRKGDTLTHMECCGARAQC